MIPTCTLKRSPEEPNTALVAGEVISSLEERGVECETPRIVDLNILPAPPTPRPTAARIGRSRRPQTAKTCAHNLYHVARALREHPIPPE
jgi:hypothetical protein